MMTRKHFKSLAASIAKLNLFNHDAAYGMACDVADVCAKDNPRFDRLRFFEACGFPGGFHLRAVPVEYVDASRYADGSPRDEPKAEPMQWKHYD